MKPTKTSRQSPEGCRPTAPLRSPNGRFKTTAGMITSQRLLKDSKQLTGKTSQRTSTPIGRGVTKKRRIEEAVDVPGKKPRKKLLDGNNPDASLFNSELSVIEQHETPTKLTRSSKTPLELSLIKKSPNSFSKTGSSLKTKTSPKKQLLKSATKSFQGTSKTVRPQILKKSTRVRHADDSLLSKRRMSHGNELPCLSIPVDGNKKAFSNEDSNANASKSSSKDLDVDKSPAKPESQAEIISNPRSSTAKSPSRKSKQRLIQAPIRYRTLSEKTDTNEPANVGVDFSKHDFSPGINTRQRIKSGQKLSSPHESTLENSGLEGPTPHPGSSTEDDSSLLAGTSIETSAGDSLSSVIDITADTSSSIEQPSYSLRRSHLQVKKATASKMTAQKAEKSAVDLKIDPEPQVVELFSPPNSTRNKKPKRTTSPNKQSDRLNLDASQAGQVQEDVDTRVTRSCPTKDPEKSITSKNPVSSSNANDEGRSRKHESISKPCNMEKGTSKKTIDIQKETVNAHVSKDTKKSKEVKPATNNQDAKTSVRKTQSKEAVKGPFIPDQDQKKPSLRKTESNLAAKDETQEGSSLRKPQSKASLTSLAIPDKIQKRSSFMIPKETMAERESRKTRSGKMMSVHDDEANVESTHSSQSPHSLRKLRSSDVPNSAPNLDQFSPKSHKLMGKASPVANDPEKSPSVSKDLSQQIEKMRNLKTGEEILNNPMPLRYMLQKDKHRNQIKKKINDIVDSLEFASDEESLADLVGMHSSSMEDHSEASSVKATEKDPKDVPEDASDEMNSIDDPDEIFLRQIQLSEEPSESSLELKSPKSLPPKKRLKVLYPRRKSKTSDPVVNNSTDSDALLNSSQDDSIYQHQSETTNGVIQTVPNDVTKKLQRRTSPRRTSPKRTSPRRTSPRRTSPRRSKSSKDREIEPYHSPVREPQGGITLRSSRRLTTEDHSSMDSLPEPVTSTLEHPYGKLQVVVLSDTSTESLNSALSDSGSKELNLSSHSTPVHSGIPQKIHHPSTMAKSDLKQQRTLNTQPSKDDLFSKDVQQEGQTEASSVRPPLITDPIFSKPASQDGPQQMIQNMRDGSSQDQPALSKMVHYDKNAVVNVNSDVEIATYGSAKKKAEKVSRASTQKAMAPNLTPALSKSLPPEIVQKSSNVVSNAPYVTIKQVTAPSTTNTSQIPYILPASTVIQGPLTQSFPRAPILPQRQEEHLASNPPFSVQQHAMASATIPVLSPVITHNYIVNTVPQLAPNLPNVVQQIQTIQPFTVIQLPTEPTVLKLTPVQVHEPQTVPVLLPQRLQQSQVFDRNCAEAQNQTQPANISVAKAVTSLPQRPTVITKPSAPSRIQASSSKTHPYSNAASCQPVILSSSTSNANSVNKALASQSIRPTLEINQSKTVNHNASNALAFTPIKNEPLSVVQGEEARISQATDDKPVVIQCSSIVKNEPVGVIDAVLMENIPTVQPTVATGTNIVKSEPVPQASNNAPTIQEAVPLVVESIRSLNQEEPAPVQTFDGLNKELSTQNELEATTVQEPREADPTTEDVSVSFLNERESIVQQSLEVAQDAVSFSIACITELQAAAQSVDDVATAPEITSIFAADAVENIENTEPLSADQFSNLMEECSKIVASGSPIRAQVEGACSATQNEELETPSKACESSSAENVTNPTKKDSSDNQAKASSKSAGKEIQKKSKKKPVKKSEKITKSQVIEIPEGETARTIITKPSFGTRHERIDSASLNNKKKKRWILNTEFESLYRKVRLDHTQNTNTNVAFITNLIDKASELVEHASDNDDEGLEAIESISIIKESVPGGTSELLPKAAKDATTSKKKKTKLVKNQTLSKQSDPLDIPKSIDLQDSVLNVSVSASASQKQSATKSKKLEQTASSLSKKNSLSSPVTAAKRVKKIVPAQRDSKSHTPSKTNVDNSSSLTSGMLGAQSPLADDADTSTANSTTKKQQPTTLDAASESSISAASIIVTTASDLAKTTSMITELKKTTATIAQMAQSTTKVTSAAKTPTMSTPKATLVTTPVTKATQPTPLAKTTLPTPSLAKTTLPTISVGTANLPAMSAANATIPTKSATKATFPTMMTPVVPRFLQATAVDDLPPPKGRRISRVRTGQKPPVVISVVAKDVDGSSDLNSNNNNNKSLESRTPTMISDLVPKDTPSMEIEIDGDSSPALADKDHPMYTEISKVKDLTPDASTTPAHKLNNAIDPSVVPATSETSVHELPKVINANAKISNHTTEEISEKSKPRSRRSSGKSNVPPPKSSLSNHNSEKEPSSTTVSDIPESNSSSPRPPRRLRSLSGKSVSLSITQTNAPEPESQKEEFLKSLSLTSSFDDPLNDSSVVHEDEPPISKKKTSKDHSSSSKPFSKEDLSQTESNVSRILKQIELRQQADHHAADVQIPQMITPDKSRKARSRSNFNPAVGSRKSSRKLNNSFSATKVDLTDKDSKSNEAKSSEIGSDDPKRSSKEQRYEAPSRSKPKKKSKAKKDAEHSDPEHLCESVSPDLQSVSLPFSSPEKSSTQREAMNTLMKSPAVPVKSITPSPKRASQKDAGSRIIPTIALPEPDNYSHPAVSSIHAAPLSPSSSIPNTDLGYSSQSLSRSSSISDISNRSFSKPRMVQKTLFDFNIGDRRKSAPPRPLVGANERRITRTIIIYDETTGTVSNTSDGACQTMVEDLERTLVKKISKSVTVCDSSCQTSDLPFTDMVNGTVHGSPLDIGHTSIGTSPIKQPQQLQSTDASLSIPHSKGSSTGPDGKISEPSKKSKVPQNILDEYEKIIAFVASNIPKSPASSPVNSKKTNNGDLRKKILKKSGKKAGAKAVVVSGDDFTVTSTTDSDVAEESHQSQSSIGSPDHSVVLSDVDQTVNVFSSPGYQSSLKLSEEALSSADEAGADDIEFDASTDDDSDTIGKSSHKKSKMIVKLPCLTPKKNQGSPEKRTPTSKSPAKGKKRIRSPENMKPRKRLMLDPEDSDVSNDFESDPEMVPTDGEGQERDGEESSKGQAPSKNKKVRGRPSKRSNRGRKSMYKRDSDDGGEENNKLLKCMNCDKEFPSLKELKAHMMMNHTKLYSASKPEGVADHAALKFILKKLGRLTCSDCGKIHRNIQYYTFHQKWCGREEEMSHCELCDRMVQSMWLQQHYREHRNREHYHDQKLLSDQNAQQKIKVIDGKRQAALRARTHLHDLTKELLMRNSDDSEGSALEDKEYVGRSGDESSDSDVSGMPERGTLFLGQMDHGVCKRSFGDNYLPTDPDLFEEIVQWYQKHPRADHLHKILLPVIEDWIALSEERSNQFLPKYKQSVQFIVSQYRYEDKRKTSKPIVLDWSQSFVTRDQATSYCGGAIDAIEWCPLPTFKSTNHYAAVACHMTREQPIGFFNPPEGYSLIHIWSFGLINPLKTTVKPTLSLTMVHDYNIASCLCWCPQGTWQNPAHPVEEENVYHRLGLLAVGSVDGNVRIFSVPHPFDEEEGSEVKPRKLYQPKPYMILKTIENSGTGACVAVSWQNTSSCDNIVAGYANGVVRIWNITATSPLLVSYTESGIKMVHPIKSFFAHSRPIRDVAWNPKDGNVFATSGDDKRLRIWRLDSVYKDMDVLVVGTPVTSLAWPLLECGLVFGKDNIYLNDRSQTGFHDCGIKPSILRYSPTNHHGAIVDVEFSDWHNIILSCDTYGAIKGARFRDTSFEDINIHAIAHREFSVYMTDIRFKKTVKIPTEDSAPNSQTNQSSADSSQNNQTSSASSQQNQTSSASSQNNQTSSAFLQNNQTSAASSQNVQSNEKPAESPQPDVANKNGADNHMTNTNQSTTSKKKVDKYDYHSYKETDEKCCLEFIDYPLTEVRAGRKKKISGKIDIRKLSCFPIESLRAISVSKNVFGSTWLLSGGEAGFLRLHNMSGVMAATGRQYMEDKIPKES